MITMKIKISKAKERDIVYTIDGCISSPEKLVNLVYDGGVAHRVYMEDAEYTKLVDAIFTDKNITISVNENGYGTIS